MITFAVMINVLILAIALPMDLGRAYMASSAIAGAADAGAVASAVEGGDDDTAKAYFMANLPVGTLGISYNYDTDVTHTVDSTAGTVSISTTGFDVPAFFSGAINLNSAINVGGSNLVGLPSAALLPADYFFIIDSSGSMSGSSGSGNSKSQAVGIAMNNFLDLVFANQGIGPNGVPNYRVSLTNYRSSYSNTYGLSGDKPTLVNWLNPMLNPSGATCGGCGLRDAKERLIEAAQAGNSSRRRYIIFLTDGMLNQGGIYMSPQPPGYDGASHGPLSHGMAAMECYSMKNLHTHPHQTRNNGSQSVNDQQDVSIWTVRFGNGANGGPNLALMDYCASDPAQSVWAQTGNDLDQIFSQIGSTSRIRVLE